ncbi:5'-methylthioadenosine/adenosylhomocysteine nucleosidase [Niastella caeni]|uniref:adenosylhomocysteine nucleosidase n=1 Tax=Niastella caeni TaxID=2569763 RepID=A0A4S8HL55_9BACT|nr:5'-methylthioadenosine/adenosylhomocysteine nucleosidase [Niastella caeni]THU36030.1 5'-methylthioadenosine/adenosylhomocysteine nucleosidase [Niastella caeni]
MRTTIVLLAWICCSFATQAQAKNSNVTGILGAFADEINYLLTQVQQKKETIIQQVHFTEGILQGKKVVIAQTGIGKVNAAITTTLMLEHYKPRAIIFTGIAGGVNPALQPGDLVIGTRVAYHDYGAIVPDSIVRKPTRNPFTLKENPLYFSCDTVLVARARSISHNISLEKIRRANGEQAPQIISGTIVTGDVFVSSNRAAQNLADQLQADATEMEGAAVAQVCWQQKTPFIVIRSMSDNANNNAHTDVAAFYQIAARNSAKFVMAILK